MRIFHGLPGVFAPGQVIFFPVVHGGDTVCVCSQIVEFGSSLV
jgi:hypothetical protein